MPEFDPFSTSTKFHGTQRRCVCSFAGWLTHRHNSCERMGGVHPFEAIKGLNLANVTSSAALAWQSSAALRRLKQLVNESGWNGCYSKRYQFDEA